MKKLSRCGFCGSNEGCECTEDSKLAGIELRTLVSGSLVQSPEAKVSLDDTFEEIQSRTRDFVNGLLTNGGRYLKSITSGANIAAPLYATSGAEPYAPSAAGDDEDKKKESSSSKSSEKCCIEAPAELRDRGKLTGDKNTSQLFPKLKSESLKNRELGPVGNTGRRIGTLVGRTDRNSRRTSVSIFP